MIGLADPEVVATTYPPPSWATTVNPVMGEPLAAGALNDTVADPFPRTTVTPVGAPGAVAVDTIDDATEGSPVPTALVAVTV